MESTASPVPPDVRLLEIMFDAVVQSRACYAAAKLRLADLLQDQERSSQDLAVVLGVDARALYRLLRCLSVIGVVTEGPAQHFSLTELGATLRSDVATSTRPFVEFFGSPFYLEAWVDILTSIQTGRPAFDHVHGQPLFAFLAEHPAESRIFDEAMASLTPRLGPEVMAVYDFAPFRRIVDVGGGSGSFLFSLLLAHPQATGVLFDQSHVLTDAHQESEALGLAGRCEIVSGDFFVEVPAGGDAYLLKWILHDWDDDACERILGSCRRAIAPHGKVLLVETVVPPAGVPHHAKLDDLEMLVLLGSQERTEQEYAALVERSGFRLGRIVPTATDLVSVIEADPV